VRGAHLLEQVDADVDQSISQRLALGHADIVYACRGRTTLPHIDTVYAMR
jgi:hypothetical protein